MKRIESDAELTAEFGHFSDSVDHWMLYCGDESDVPDEDGRYPNFWAIDSLQSFDDGRIMTTFTHTDDFYIESCILDIFTQVFCIKFYDSERTAKLCRDLVLKYLDGSCKKFPKVAEQALKLSDKDREVLKKWYSNDDNFVVIGYHHC